MLQQIINWIMGNAFLIIIIGGGLFNLAVRMAQKAKEQRSKRAAGHEMARQKQENLRTGHSVSPPTPIQAQRSQKDQRQERIEALRKERMDQLRALREKRSGTQVSASTATSPSSISQNHPNMPPIPVQQRPQARPQPRRTAVPNAGQQTRRPNIVATPQAPSPRRRPQQAQVQSQPQQRRRVKSTENVRHAGHVETLREASNLSLHDTVHSKSKAQPVQSARSMLRSRSSVRQAMLLREILDTPVGLRDQDIASGSLF